MENQNNIRPLVSIITINYNQSEVTKDLLRSLRKITYPSYEIIVVDNASPNDNPDSIKDEFPEIVLIKSNVNLGFAGGNNLGVRQSKGDYFLFINNDVEVPAGFLETLVETLENNTQIGMVSPKIKFHWNPDLIQYAGYTPMSHWTIRNNSIGYHQPDSALYDQAGPTASVHGAAMMISRRVALQVGLMTEIYFLYYEEHDWAEAVKRAGYQLFYQPASYILHKESLSTGKESPLKTYYINRNRILFARRNFKGIHLLFSLLFQIFVSIPKNSIKFLVSKRVNHFKVYWKAIFWNLTHFKVIHQTVKL
jgi:GT2 family glycosyltransferase